MYHLYTQYTWRRRQHSVSKRRKPITHCCCFTPRKNGTFYLTAGRTSKQGCDMLVAPKKRKEFGSRDFHFVRLELPYGQSQETKCVILWTQVACVLLVQCRCSDGVCDPSFHRSTGHSATMCRPTRRHDCALLCRRKWRNARVVYICHPVWVAFGTGGLC
jgi:hypothetical protein